MGFLIGCFCVFLRIACAFLRISSDLRKGTSKIQTRLTDPQGKIKKLYFLLVLLFLLHNDFWLWGTPQLVFRVPVGLLYHIGYCVAATLLMAALVKARGDWGER